MHTGAVLCKFAPAALGAYNLFVSVKHHPLDMHRDKLFKLLMASHAWTLCCTGVLQTHILSR